MRQKTKYIFLRLSILVLLLVVPLSSSLAQPKLKHFSITKGRLVFSHVPSRSRPADLWVVDFENLEVKQLTKTPYSEAHPRWSPDGLWVAFDANKDGNKDIFLTSWDGTLLKQLTATPENEEAPDWSPDGKAIVFYRKGDKTKKYLYRIAPDGSDESPLASSMKNASTPRWSPRGDEVLFSTNKFWPGWDIGTLKLSSGESQALSVGKRSYARPTWHPKGTSIAFGYGSGDDFDIYTVEKGEKDPKKVAARPGRDTDPEWSANGKYLFFVSEVTKGEGNYQVFVKDLANEDIHQVTTSSGFIRFPAYTPHPSLENFAPKGTTLVRPAKFFEPEEETNSEDSAIESESANKSTAPTTN